MTRTLLISALLGVLGACLSGCPQTGCSASTCAGCCDARGVCQMGTTSATCGARGMLCTECGVGMTCSNSTCQLSFGSGGGVSGTGGGLSGTGGGSSNGGGQAGGFATAGGFVRIDQELVSGSRLRAINLVGPDGSRAPLMFWDTQLNTVCNPSLFYGDPHCFPAVSFPLMEGSFADSACTQQLYGYASTLPGLGPEQYVAAGLPSPRVYGYQAVSIDGGSYNFSFVSLSPATARFTKSGTTCTPATITGQVYLSTGTVANSAFAPMSVVRE